MIGSVTPATTNTGRISLKEGIFLLQYSMKTTRTTVPLLWLTCISLVAGSCRSDADTKTTVPARASTIALAAAPPAETTSPNKSTIGKADASAILARREVPVLCYHQIRDWQPTDSKTAQDYIVPVENFRQQMKMLADSGYHTILPDQLYAYLTTGAALPSKPVMLTFDDTKLDQYNVAIPEMKKYGFKGVFFVMTVSLDRPHYMSKAQVKEIADAGHVIGSHTWDHHNVKKYEGKDWVTQIEKPSKELEAITGKPINYFAYPFGLWNPPAIPQLKQRGFKAAFQLVEKRDKQDPLYTIRRIIVPGSWTIASLRTRMLGSFRINGE
jgi:peptidoglycan/xylan/chitin deacetylase (PgdA/CDA1 family)